ncbi:MAG: hypothetical protein KDA68_04065 [Planctomycetaceae bacterium]|nr:hypothetical protein [Planctomycetaceae bacterium]
MMEEEEGQREFPIIVVVVLMMIVVGVFGWCFMAKQYSNELKARENEGRPEQIPLAVTRRRRGLGMMIGAIVDLTVTGITQIPNLEGVLSFNFTKRLWLPVSVIVVEGLLVGVGFGLKHVEEQLEDPPKRKKKKRRRKIFNLRGEAGSSGRYVDRSGDVDGRFGLPVVSWGTIFKVCVQHLLRSTFTRLPESMEVRREPVVSHLEEDIQSETSGSEQAVRSACGCMRNADVIERDGGLSSSCSRFDGGSRSQCAGSRIGTPC